jgi:hypothetical protein
MQTTPAQPAVEPIDLTRWAEVVDRAAPDGFPCVAASAAGDDYPDMSFKGSLMVLDRDHLAWWEWSLGTQLDQIERHPRVSVLYRSTVTKLFLRWYGEATVYRDGALRDEVMARAPERELQRDPDRKGAAVVVRVDVVRSGNQIVQQRGS